MRTFVLLLCTLFFAACGGDDDTNTDTTTGNGGGNTPQSSEKVITAFAFENVNNDSLSTDITADINDTTITATVPFGTDVTALVPTITLSNKATISPASGTATDFSNPVTYTVTAEDNTTQAYTVTITVTKSTKKDITSFVFELANNSAAIDVDVTADVSGTNITATLIAGTNVTMLTPTITISDYATVNPTSGTPTDFTAPVTYTVTAEDGTKQNYTITLTVPAFGKATNGITILCPGIAVGDTFEIDGVTYTKRSKDQITFGNAPTTCTTGITDMSTLFNPNTPLGTFNDDITHWDTSGATNMEAMFLNSRSFNQDIGAWDVSRVENMKRMFNGVDAFNQDISGWNTSNVTNMEAMFLFATDFNQDISGWCVSLIATEPTNFSENSFLEGSNKPNWGATCTP